MRALSRFSFLVAAVTSLPAALPALAQKSPAGRAGIEWWSLQPLKNASVPVVRNRTARVENPIDSFLLAKLRLKELGFAPPAERRTLIRRVTFDLIGLPPTPAEIDSFVKDRSPNAYERLVDRLLADPRYGERWGRHWLDVARFGESNGFERDQFRPNAWRYRDYVVNAFNRDENYFQFVREQIAGDVIEQVTPEGIAATGFLVVGPYDEVGHTLGSDLMRARVREEEMEEVVGTVAQTFLGLTVNCARCHDHKFDPITQRDYYRFKAALDGVTRGDRPLLSAEMDRERVAQVEHLRTDLQAADERLASITRTIRARVAASRKGAAARLVVEPYARWTFDAGPADVQGRLGGTLEGGARIENGRLILDGKAALLRSRRLDRELREKTLETWVVVPSREQRGGAPISIQDPSKGQFDAIVYGEREPGKWAAGSDLFRRTKDLDAPPETSPVDSLLHLAIVYRADNSIAVYRNGRPYAPPYMPTGEALRTYAAASSEVLLGLRHAGAGNGFFAGEVEEARVYDRALTSEQVYASYQAGVDNVSPDEVRRTATADERAAMDRAQADAGGFTRRLAELSAPPLAYAVVSTQPPPTRVLARGDVESPGETVGAGMVSCAAAGKGERDLAPDAPESMRRLQLAAWMGDPRNPLAARVIVNRVWHYHFGRGIVASPNDFGYNGEPPSHPELLDWLAVEFTHDLGGSIKRLHRLILLSAAYRQSAAYDAKAASLDADDRLLWRWSPQRLEGEAVRDAMLFVSGQLNPVRGGPSFKPWTVVVDNSHFYTQFDSAEPEYNRRTLYRASVNSARNAMLETLDCPDPSTKTPRRAVTTTPLQALELMNNGFVLRQARELAHRLERESLDRTARIRAAYAMCFGREPSPNELKSATAFVSRSGIEPFCWSLFNATEFLYVR